MKKMLLFVCSSTIVLGEMDSLNLGSLVSEQSADAWIPCRSATKRALSRLGGDKYLVIVFGREGKKQNHRERRGDLGVVISGNCLDPKAVLVVVAGCC
jgi:hypothetical protein